MKKTIQSVLAVSLLLGGAAPLEAQTPLYWSGVSGTWTNASLWYTDAAGTIVSGSAPNSGNSVYFNTDSSLTVTSTVTLSGTSSVYGLTFATTGSTLVTQPTGNTSRNLLLGAGGITLNANSGNVNFGISQGSLRVEAVDSQTWTNNSNSTLNVRSLVAGNTASGTAVNVTLNAASGGTISFALGVADSADTTKKLGLIIDSSGTGNVSLGAGGTYSGGTYVKRGLLSTSNNMGTGSVLLSGTSGADNARIHLTGTSTNNITVQAGSSGTAALTAANNADYQGDIILNRDVVIGSYSSTSMSLNFNGDISGTGSVTVMRMLAGTPTVVMGGSNTYTGKTTIAAANLVVSSLNSVSGGTSWSSLGAPTTVANATILLSTSGSSSLRYVGAGETTDRAIEIGSSLGSSIDQNGSGTLKFTSDLTNSGSGSRTLTLQGSTAGVGEFAGAINNIASGTNVGVTKNGTGTWQLSGTANTYAGTTSVAGGILEVTKLANTNAASSIGTGAIGNLSFSSGTLRYIGTGDASNRVLQFGAAGGTIDASGSGAVNLTRTTAPAYGSSNVAISITLTGTNTDANTYAANQNNNGTGAVSLTKNGTGTWVLTGNSVNTGTTTINAGTLLLNGSLAAGSAVALNSAILGGSGTANGLVTTSGTGSTISPGNSPGTLRLNGGLNATAGATFVFELGTTSDVLSLGAGTFTGSAGAGELVFNFADAGGLTAGNPYTLITFGSASGLDYSDLMAAVLPSGYVLDSSFGTGGFLINSNNLQVQFAVPEPSTALLLAGGLTMAVILRRRRQS
jgi:fibronectin-binding autotransporter adhesin